MNIHELLSKANAAVPEAKSRAQWAPLLPVVVKLKGQGFSTWEAVSWLIGQKAVPIEKQRAAYHSIVNCLKRAEAKRRKFKTERPEPV